MVQQISKNACEGSSLCARLLVSLRDSFLCALCVFFLSFFILGIQIVPEGNSLTLVPRWNLIGFCVLSAFIVRFLFHCVVWGCGHAAPSTKEKTPGAARAYLRNIVCSLGEKAGLLLVGFALVLPFLPFTGRHFLDLSILILTYVMLGWGLNIVIGLAGLLDLGYVAFYAVGAYSYALLSTLFFPWMIEQGLLGSSIMPWVFWLCLPVAGVLAALWGLALGFPVLRLRGDYLAIVTLAFAEIVRLVLLNWYPVTGGPDGISKIPRLSFFGIDFSPGKGGFADLFGLEYSTEHRIIFSYYLILMLALFTNFVTLRLRKVHVGRAWEALREDETACRSLGINTTSTKLTAFATGAMFGGLAGAFFATRQGFINPESFVFMESALILSIVVLGGLGSQLGIVFAAIIMIGGIELARELHFLKIIFGPGFDPSLYRMLVFGLIMVFIMIWRPRGLVRHRTPSLSLKKEQLGSGDLVAEERG